MTAETEYVLADGALVKPRRTPNENAQAAWQQVLSVLTMLEDMVKGGAKVTLTRSPVFPKADHKLLMASAIASQVGRILQTAEVIDGK